MIKIRFKRFLMFCILCGTLIQSSFAQYYDDTLRIQTAVNLDVLSKLGAKDRGKLVVEKKPNDTPFENVEVNIVTDFLIPGNEFNNVLIYQNTARITPWDVSYHAETYSNCKFSLGDMASKFDRLAPWQSDNIEVSAREAKEYFVGRVYKTVYDKLLQSRIPVRIEICKDKSTELKHVYLYGVINEVTDLITDQGLKFDPAFQYGNTKDDTHKWSDPINHKIKNPINKQETVDVLTAAHRGFWGKDLGSGPAENTLPSIEEAKKYTDYVETDITMTKDDSIVVSHDYNLQRLTDYEGTDWPNKFLYKINFSEIEDLHLRRKNTTVTEFKFRQLRDIIRDVKTRKVALHLDLKEIINRSNPLDGSCTATCDYDKKHLENRLQSWIHLCRRILDIVKQENAWSYVTIKTHHTPIIIKSKLKDEIYKDPQIAQSDKRTVYDQYLMDMRRLHFLPVIQPKEKKDFALNVINEWHNEEPNLVLAYEINFLTPEGENVKPFSIGTGENKKDYQNVLHYVLDATGLRPAFYSEEPAGPKGIVDRYAQWKIKNLSTDFRGDHFWLMSIPYFSQSLVTTDRVDIWDRIKEIYTPKSYSIPAEYLVKSSPALVENLNVYTETKITATYNEGVLSINGLDKNDIGSYISLSDIQGRLIYRKKVRDVPQMNISRNLQSGMCIVTLSGYRQVNVKLIIK